jgi:cupin 2 domain-containing protein
MADGNLFHAANPPARGGRFETLLAHRNLVVERIVSGPDTQPVPCVQAQDEWVLLVRGAATLPV